MINEAVFDTKGRKVIKVRCAPKASTLDAGAGGKATSVTATAAPVKTVEVRATSPVVVTKPVVVPAASTSVKPPVVAVPTKPVTAAANLEAKVQRAIDLNSAILTAHKAAKAYVTPTPFPSFEQIEESRAAFEAHMAKQRVAHKAAMLANEPELVNPYTTPGTLPTKNANISLPYQVTPQETKLDEKTTVENITQSVAHDNANAAKATVPPKYAFGQFPPIATATAERIRKNAEVAAAALAASSAVKAKATATTASAGANATAVAASAALAAVGPSATKDDTLAALDQVRWDSQAANARRLNQTGPNADADKLPTVPVNNRPFGSVALAVPVSSVSAPTAYSVPIAAKSYNGRLPFTNAAPQSVFGGSSTSGFGTCGYGGFGYGAGYGGYGVTNLTSPHRTAPNAYTPGSGNPFGTAPRPVPLCKFPHRAPSAAAAGASAPPVRHLEPVTNSDSEGEAWECSAPVEGKAATFAKGNLPSRAPSHCSGYGANGQKFLAKGNSGTISLVQNMLDTFLRDLNSTLVDNFGTDLAADMTLDRRTSSVASSPATTPKDVVNEEEEFTAQVPGGFEVKKEAAVAGAAIKELGSHPNVYCDGQVFDLLACSTIFIPLLYSCGNLLRGLRHKCTVCRNYDLVSFSHDLRG